MINNCSVIKEIKRAEDDLQLCYQKVTELENTLQTKTLSFEHKKLLELELQEIRKLLSINEDHLSQLQGENRRSFALAALLFFLIFLIYGLYIMIMGLDL